MGVCIIYNKNFLLLKVIDIRHSINTRVHQLQNKNREKLFNFIILYRSPSQSRDDFEAFLKNFELNLDTILTNHPFLTAVFVILILSLTFSLTVKKTSYEGSGIVDLTFQFNEPTHLTKNSSSCIDLMFTSQPTLVMKPGLKLSSSNNLPQI